MCVRLQPEIEVGSIPTCVSNLGELWLHMFL